MIKKKKYLLSPTLKRNGVRKRGVQAGAVNVLHCICVSGYYYYHYNYYHYYHYYCISTQATSIIKRALIGLACVAWAGNYVITGRARGTREGESRPPLLFSPHASSTFLLLPLPSPLPPRKKTKQQQQKNWRLLCRLWLAILWNVYAWVNARKENGGDGPGAGEIKVCPCYTDSSIMSSKVRKSRHLCKFNGMMQNCTKLIGCSLLCARTVCSVIYYLNHTDHPPNAQFLHAVSPQKSRQNCTSWQWCSFIFSTRVNLVKQDGPKIYKYRRRNR